MKNCLASLLTVFLFSTQVFAQAEFPKKDISATRIAERIIINGRDDEAGWKSAPVATGFFWKWPNAGAVSTTRTEVRVLYDDNAVYFYAKCFDSPDSIARPLTKRDENDNSDWFGVIIDTYEDGQNALEFDVMPSGVQFDSKYSLAAANPDNGDADGEDSSWDGVWKSATSMLPDGWSVEIEVPYSAIRFPKKQLQNWNINFLRHVSRRGELDCWNRVMPDQRTLAQAGKLTGIENIKAPLRLSATPFLAQNFTNSFDKSASPTSAWGRQFSAGMDLKFGLNEAFTLDATLVPDFAQVKSDAQVLNLSPFEVRFDENRPFFTEGTELFNKGGLFYSRRIGNRPLHYWDVEDEISDNEEIVENPASVRLLNATKISGRTKGGTGIGVFNAVEGATTATIKNIETGETRQVETSSLTDKSVVVIDQNLPHNSSFTFINTAAVRQGGDVDADVTGATWYLRNKKNSYAFYGNAYGSQRFFADKTVRGNAWGANIEKTSGKWTWHLGNNVESANYNPNDLGFLYSPNEVSALAWVSYNQFKKTKHWNNWWTSLWTWNGRYYSPNVPNSTAIGWNMGGNTPGFHNVGINMRLVPGSERDYFEPRTEGFDRYFRIPGSFRVNYWYNSDRRKLWQVSQGMAFTRRGGYGGRTGLYPWAGLSWRPGKKLTLGFFVNLDYSKGDVGYAGGGPDESSTGYGSLLDSLGGLDAEKIVFGRRDILGLDNALDINFTFNTRMNLRLGIRHYWNRVSYNHFYLLKNDGRLAPTDYAGEDASGTKLHDVTANFFNIDCVYSWRFAPGSDLLLVWKNAIYDETEQATEGYFNGLGAVPTLPMQNSLSLKVLYYLDYAAVKKRF